MKALFIRKHMASFTVITFGQDLIAPFPEIDFEPTCPATPSGSSPPILLSSRSLQKIQLHYPLLFGDTRRPRSGSWPLANNVLLS